MRLFIGLPLSAEATSELSHLTINLRSRDDSFRWSAPDSWHITLQFLGNSSHEQYQCIVERFRTIRLPPVSITFESFGFFERSGIFYLGVRNTKYLNALHRSVTAATALCGFPTEERTYHPHITLARSKGKQGMDALNRLRARISPASRFTGFLAEHFLIYESFADSFGSRYEIRERFGFNDIEAP